MYQSLASRQYVYRKTSPSIRQDAIELDIPVPEVPDQMEVDCPEEGFGLDGLPPKDSSMRLSPPLDPEESLYQNLRFRGLEKSTAACFKVSY
jgi:hypothetical protein